MRKITGSNKRTTILNRSCQSRAKRPSTQKWVDATIRDKFDTYRFADFKEKVIDLLMRVTTVSVETVAIVEAMKSASR